MKMSEEMAVRLHRMMWSDMQKELGDCPNYSDRNSYKEKWCKTHFPEEYILFNCFLCDYCGRDGRIRDCDACPIKWPDGRCSRPFGMTPVKADYRYAPISEILALPARNEKLVAEYVANDEAAVARSYYEYREQLLSKASGIPATLSIEDHVKAIREKVVDELAKASGLPAANTVTDHISAIQEKAVEDYFKKTPGAKLATMDVDQAFKQYADEQKAPIFHDLAEASGLSAGNESVKAHISLIRNVALQNGRLERSGRIFQALSAYSGVSKDNWSVHDHAEAIMKKASNEKDMETLKTVNAMLADKVNNYKDKLSEQSGLDRNRPVDDHIREIIKNSMEAGAAEERDRIQENIYEVLLS